MRNPDLAGVRIDRGAEVLARITRQRDDGHRDVVMGEISVGLSERARFSPKSGYLEHHGRRVTSFKSAVYPLSFSLAQDVHSLVLNGGVIWLCSQL